MYEFKVEHQTGKLVIVQVGEEKLEIKKGADTYMQENILGKRQREDEISYICKN